MLGLAVVPAAEANDTPILAGPWSLGQKGYGQAKPKTIFNGGDPSGLVNRIRWSSWGGPHAVGFGIGLWVGPHTITLHGKRQPAKIVLFKLGTCHGRSAYNAIEWYFPQHEVRFDPGTYINACTGTHYLNGHAQP